MMIEDDDEHVLGDLLVYEPYSGHMKSLGITAIKYLWNVSSCIETLLLLDNWDSSFFDIAKSVDLGTDDFWSLEHASKVWRLKCRYSAN